MTDTCSLRTAVVGATCSGKSTLANRLAEKISADFIELDALHWEPHWQEAPLELFRARVQSAIQAEKWVSAGNYHVVRDLLWARAQTVIWLDYPFSIVFWRLVVRSIRRSILQEELWNGNRENLRTHLRLWSEDSLFHWLFKTYWRRKLEFPLLFRLPQHAHLRVIKFNHPREADSWLSTIHPP
ncbi:MAG: adenylate kinase [Chloroflexi bacterium]|nr:adenylate kinase [Chloroflexota bacterium]